MKRSRNTTTSILITFAICGLMITSVSQSCWLVKFRANRQNGNYKMLTLKNSCVLFSTKDRNVCFQIYFLETDTLIPLECLNSSLPQDIPELMGNTGWFFSSKH